MLSPQSGGLHDEAVSNYKPWTAALSLAHQQVLNSVFADFGADPATDALARRRQKSQSRNRRRKEVARTPNKQALGLPGNPEKEAKFIVKGYRSGPLRPGYPFMGLFMTSHRADSDALLRQLQTGDNRALAELFQHYRGRLRQMVWLRLDRRLHRRVDPSDILQESYLDLARRLPEYLAKPTMPFFLWLRLVTGQRLLMVHRQHFGTQKRDIDQEVSLFAGPLPQASSASLAAHLLGRLTMPSQAAVRAELQLRLQEALNQMEPIDREILTLRHFEELSNSETAQALGLQKAAASNRYVRALKRLREVLASNPGFFEP